MTVLSGQTIRHLGIFTPFVERSAHPASGTTGGLGPAGYDIHIRESLTLAPGAFVLVSSVEHFDLPADILAEIKDKSTLARRGLDVKNTVAEPGWRGYLTLELTNNHPPWRPSVEDLFTMANSPAWAERGRSFDRLLADEAAYDAAHTITLIAGQPIAQVLLKRCDELCERPYDGRYQDQPARPVYPDEADQHIVTHERDPAVERVVADVRTGEVA